MRLSRLLSLALLVALAPLRPVYAAEDELRVAIVYNIIRFTRFPQASQDHITLCVVGDPDLLRAFSQLDGKPVPNGRLIVRSIGRPAELRSGCTIAFVGENDQVLAIDGILMTVGESPDFASRGGTVGLRRFGRQISFELNPQAGARRGVEFSSSLLNLAQIVRTR